MDQSQVEALEQKHAQLEALIDEEEHRPHPDDIRLHELKKEKPLTEKQKKDLDNRNGIENDDDRFQTLDAAKARAVL